MRRFSLICLISLTALLGCDGLNNRDIDINDTNIDNEVPDQSTIDCKVSDSDIHNNASNDSNFEIDYQDEIDYQNEDWTPNIGNIFEMIDKETGVHYLVVSQYGYGITITPLYNSDGSLKISEVNIQP
ncbi:DUF6440 family protein [uncultured Clostridium sp.]|uniref:DUF6440 family protein n=1 Tax=uncultured Clostridium sp. TaxID=59620 RepID=UPI00261A5636|nr:DUF6440 family protein [uncultured Clostridium sp.]